MNITEQQARELYERLGKRPSTFRQNGGDPKYQAVAAKPAAPVYASGPLSVSLVLWGHCPSKKNGWRSTGKGKLFIPAEMKAQIDILTTQALFQWRIGAPVQHPDVTARFFVSAARQDEDGMWTTILDCLQKAGVLVNDNIAHFNGRKVHEPCEFVEADKERVEILLEKK